MPCYHRVLGVSCVHEAWHFHVGTNVGTSRHFHVCASVGTYVETWLMDHLRRKIGHDLSEFLNVDVVKIPARDCNAGMSE